MRAHPLAVGLCLTAFFAACNGDVPQDRTSKSAAADIAAPAPVQAAICRITGTAGNEAVKGAIHFAVVDGGVRVHGTVEGLKPGKHGFHVHEWGDVTCDDGVCSGGHFNPTNQPHGGPEDSERHVGDLGNLEAGEDGKASYDRVDEVIALAGANSIIGRAIIVHAGADDLKSQPTGDAGARVGYGVIGVVAPKQ